MLLYLEAAEIYLDLVQVRHVLLELHIELEELVAGVGDAVASHVIFEELAGFVSMRGHQRPSEVFHHDKVTTIEESVSYSTKNEGGFLFSNFLLFRALLDHSY